MGDLSSHQALIEKAYPINKGTIKPGMVLEFVYTKVDKKGKSSTKRYMALALSEPVKRAQDNVKMLHAISLDGVTRTALESIAKKTGLEWANSRLQARKLKVEKVVTTEPRAYYQSIIKGQLTGILKGSYRTFREDRLNAIKICEYKWPKEMLLEDSNTSSIKQEKPSPDIPTLGDK
jgi:hypothetical protein